MPTARKLSVMVCVFVMAFSAATCSQAQGTGKDLKIRGSISFLAAAKKDDQKKTGLIGWLSLKDQPGSGLRVFVKEKTKLEKMVGKERKPATFADVKKGATVELTYVLHDGQPSAGPTLADARHVLILAEPK